MKISFYFRTTKEYDAVRALITEVNEQISGKELWSRNMNTLHVASKYDVGNYNRRQAIKIPKNKPTKKKYLGVIRGNKHVTDKAGIDVLALLTENNVELAPTEDAPQKYEGEKSTAVFHLTGLTQFRTLTSVFNKRFGHGNWRVKGPKSLQKVLKNYELAKAEENTPNIPLFGNASDFYKNKFPNGIKVTIIVNDPDANIEKHLFKVKLKV